MQPVEPFPVTRAAWRLSAVIFKAASQVFLFILRVFFLLPWPLKLAVIVFACIWQPFRGV